MINVHSTDNVILRRYGLQVTTAEKPTLSKTSRGKLTIMAHKLYNTNLAK